MAIHACQNTDHKTLLHAQGYQLRPLLSARLFRSLAVSDVESLIITRQCRFLESTFQSNLTSDVLASSGEVSYHSIKKDILRLGQSQLHADASSHTSQHYVLAVASSSEGSWLKLWDIALERGVFDTTYTLRFLSLHSHSWDGSCPAPNCSFHGGPESPCAHFLLANTDLNTSLDSFVDDCVNFRDSLFPYGKCLHSCLNQYGSIYALLLYFSFPATS